MHKDSQHQLNHYFSSTWLQNRNDFDHYRLSGWALLEKISKSESVLDVGCGNNYFKGHLNVFGIDPANKNADLIAAIEEFEYDQLFDVALCLGSINFGSEQDVRAQIAKVVSHLKPASRLYWRCNPGRHDHGNSEFKSIDVFPWHFEHHEQFAKQHGYTVTELEWDSNNRIYAEWSRT